MTNILLAVICSTGVSQILKISQRSKLSTRSIFFINYLVAAGASFIRADFSTIPKTDGAKGVFFYLTALFLGLLFISAFYVYRKTIIELGVSKATTISRLSTGLPLLGSVLLFGERPEITQYIGIALIFIAIPLSADPGTKGGKRRSPWGLILFLFFGVNDFILKIVGETWPGVHEEAFLFFVFAASGLSALALMIMNREIPPLASLLPGLVLGLFNLGSSLFILRALSKLDAIVVYPLLSMGIILMGLLTGLLFWKEKMTPAHALFLAVAVGAILLIS